MGDETARRQDQVSRYVMTGQRLYADGDDPCTRRVVLGLVVCYFPCASEGTRPSQGQGGGVVFCGSARA